MATSPMSGVIQHLRTALQEGAELTDEQLLEGYLSDRDNAAFAALVRRHGPMVWGVCRRVLSNHHDAEDAFQATFLVLARRAASITSRELLANWLYGVAHQTALKGRATTAKRKERERQVTDMPEPAVTQQDQWRDLQPVLDEELSRLPDKYRGVIVLCDLEGKTRKEVAQQLGCPEGTVASRLVRARTMLARRLTHRGVALSGVALAAVLARQAASAGVPNSVVDSTIKAASLHAAGTAATGAISVKVAALTEGVMNAMLFTKLRAAIAVMLILGVTATGATILTCRTAAGQDDKEPAAEKSAKRGAKHQKQQDKDKKTVTAWGKEIGGLQAGLGFRPGAHRAYHYDETVTLVVRVRNVGKHPVKFSYLYPFIEHSPTVTDSDGKPIPQPKVLPDVGGHLPRERELAPGKEIELHELKRRIRPASESGSMQPLALYGTGKVAVQYDQVLGQNERRYKDWKLDPALSKLATGKLGLDIKPGLANLEKWTQGKGVVEVCFAGPWLDPLKLRSSLKTKVPETERDFRLECGEGGGENRSFVRVSMRVTPENVRRLLTVQAELSPRGYLLDPKATTTWSYQVDPKLDKQVRALVPHFYEVVERDLKKRIPKVKCHLKKNRFLHYEVPGTKARGFIDVHEITPGAPNTDVAVQPEAELHLPHLGLWIRLYYSGVSAKDAATHAAHDAIRKVFRGAVEPFLKLDPGAVVRNYNR